MVHTNYSGKVTTGFYDEYEIAVAGKLTIQGNCVAITIHRPNPMSGKIEEITDSLSREGDVTVNVLYGDTLFVSPSSDHTVLDYNFSVAP